MADRTPLQSRARHTPTPREIRRECERIRETWTEDELQTRSAARHRVDVQPLEPTTLLSLDGTE